MVFKGLGHSLKVFTTLMFGVVPLFSKLGTRGVLVVSSSSSPFQRSFVDIVKVISINACIRVWVLVSMVGRCLVEVYSLNNFLNLNVPQLCRYSS